MEHQRDQTGEGQIARQAQSPSGEVGVSRDLAVGGQRPQDSDVTQYPGSQYQSILPEATQQMLQELIDLPGRILPAETVHHLKNAGRETLLALYSLWQSANRAAKGEPGEKVRKHIEVE